MAVFDWVESPSTSLSEEPRIGRTRFGDGYAETAPAGLNPIAQRWSLVFSEVEDSVADDMVAFFRARVTALAGLEAFDWTPIWASSAIRVQCSQWNRTRGQLWGFSDLSATFEQVFGS